MATGRHGRQLRSVDDTVGTGDDLTAIAPHGSAGLQVPITVRVGPTAAANDAGGEYTYTSKVLPAGKRIARSASSGPPNRPAAALPHRRICLGRPVMPMKTDESRSRVADQLDQQHKGYGP